MKTFAKKKVEIVVETTMIPRLVALSRSEGVTGYTVMPVEEGQGKSGLMRDDFLSRSISARMFMVVAEPAIAESFVEAAAEMLASYRAIIIISDVAVLRNEHF